MKLYIVDLFFASLTLVSCQISGLTSGYSHLTKKEQEKIVNYKGKIADIHDFSNIYTVTVEQVKEFLSKNEKVLVYDYTHIVILLIVFLPRLWQTFAKQSKPIYLLFQIYTMIFSLL